MTTLPPIQPRPLICKTPTNNSQSAVLLLHSANQPSTVNNNNNFYSPNSDLLTNTNSPALPSSAAPLSSYEEFLKRLREFHRCRQ